MFSVPDPASRLADPDRWGEGCVQVWRVSLRAEPNQMERVQAVLSSEERERAEGFATERLTTRFTLCRAWVRIILAEYLAAPPQELQFRHTRFGKPYLIDDGHEARLKFNVSHSEELAVLAVSWDQEVGVDVETIRPIMHLDQMARRCLGPREIQAYHAAEGADRSELFLRYWTHKEAYLKATGMGLQIPLESVEFDVGGKGPKRVLCHPDGVDERFTDTHVIDFCPGPGYCGALAVCGTADLQIHYWDWCP